MLIHSASDLAKAVLSRRKQKKLSQSVTGSKVGLKQTTLSKFETKPETTQLETVFRILSSLGLEMHIMPKKPPRTTDLW